MDKLDMFQSIFGKIDKFGLWGLEIILADAAAQFTSKELKEECQTHGVNFTFSPPEQQKINGQVKVTWRTLRKMEEYIHFALMYTTYHNFPVLPIKYLINKDALPTTPFNIVTGNLQYHI